MIPPAAPAPAPAPSSNNNFPLRWESTGDQWWYAAPIDWAAANGHYDLVRQLLRLDPNHLFTLTSLRRIRRLESVWDENDGDTGDHHQFHGVAASRSAVARRLFAECDPKSGGKNSLIRGGYGGWLLYTAASAGDLGFVQLLLEKDPLLVFGEGEYGVTDVLYAAARSKNCDVFRLLFDFAVSPRFSGGDRAGGGSEPPAVFREEMVNRAVHAAARGGNLKILMELLGDHCSDVQVYRDNRGSTVLHSAAGRGQVEVVRYLLASFDIIDCKDNQGNTALHVAASRGQVAVVEALLQASASTANITNQAGETFLHMAISAFQTSSFRRLDRQVEFMKQLACGKVFNLERVINARNSQGRTALHTAIIAGIHSDLIELLMAVHSIDVNIKDAEGMTALDILRWRPKSAASETLTRQLISAGGIFSCDDFTTRRAIVSHLKMQGSGSSSPGASFTVPDTEILLYTCIENESDASADQASGRSSCSIEQSQQDLVYEHHRPSTTRKLGAIHNAAQRLKNLLQWTRMKRKKKTKKLGDNDSVESESAKRCSTSKSIEVPAPLRQQFSQPTALSNNKRIHSLRSNQPSPVSKKRFASGLMHGVMQANPHLVTPRQRRSSSFPNSSPNSLDKQISVCIPNSDDDVGPSSCPAAMYNDGARNMIHKEDPGNVSLMNHYLCFGTTALSVKEPVYRHQQNTTFRGSAIPVA